MWILVEKTGAIDTSKITALTVENSPERLYNFNAGDLEARFKVNLFEVVAHLGDTRIPIKKFSTTAAAMEYIKDLVTAEDW